jgi:hypothetical protein
MCVSILHPFVPIRLNEVHAQPLMRQPHSHHMLHGVLLCINHMEVHVNQVLGHGCHTNFIHRLMPYHVALVRHGAGYGFGVKASISQYKMVTTSHHTRTIHDSMYGLDMEMYHWEFCDGTAGST